MDDWISPYTLQLRRLRRTPTPHMPCSSQPQQSIVTPTQTPCAASAKQAVLRPHLCWLLYRHLPVTQIRLEFSSLQLYLRKWISWVLPWPVDHLAPPWLLVPFAPPSSSSLHRATSSLCTTDFTCTSSLQPFGSVGLRLGRTGSVLVLQDPGSTSTSSLQFRLGLQDLQSRLVSSPPLPRWGLQISWLHHWWFYR